MEESMDICNWCVIWMSFATLYECLLPAENSYDDLSVCLRANMCKCSLKWDYPKLFCKHDMIILQQSIHPVIHFDNSVVTTSNVYSQYHFTIPSIHSAIELPTVNSAIYARLSEHLNSLEHTLNISTAWRVQPQSQDCPSLGVQKHLEEDGEACERGIQQPAMLTIWSLRWLASPIIWASAGWSEPEHGVDQWEHSGAKHGAAHGDATLEYGCMNITYICSLD